MSLRFSFVVLAAVLSLAGVPRGASAAASVGRSSSLVPIVHTSSGRVSGTTIAAMQAYLGIPYASAPIGPLRWQPPQAHGRWPGTLAATAFGPHCPQTASPFGVASTSEDCLYLNVFEPAGTRANAKLPVMLWIHGGAFVDGESDDYDPDRMVARGVIVVTINYRLGYLGFLATSGLDAEPHAHANYGILDQQYALAWMHANAAAFGGDPARTTVFGESAGGESVFAQLLSPGSSGSFSRAIIESGAYGILSLPTLATAEANGNTLATTAGCDPANAACLRSLSVAQVLALASPTVSIGSLTSGPGPAVDGTVIPQAAETALALGEYNKVPVVQGSNHDEFRLFTALLFDLSGGPLTAAEYPAAVAATLSAGGLGQFTSLVLAQYPLANYASPDLAYSALTTDAVFATQASVTDVLFSTGTPVYAYEFADENAPEDFLPPVSFAYGAAHASEIQFIYDSFNRTGAPLSSSEQQLAATMVRYWTDFATDATPGARGLPPWAPYLAPIDDVESLVPPTPKLFFGFIPEHKVLFWTALAAAGETTGRVAAKRYLSLDAVRTAARVVRPNAVRRF